MSCNVTQSRFYSILFRSLINMTCNSIASDVIFKKLGRRSSKICGALLVTFFLLLCHFIAYITVYFKMGTKNQLFEKWKKCLGKQSIFIHYTIKFGHHNNILTECKPHVVCLLLLIWKCFITLFDNCVCHILNNFTMTFFGSSLTPKVQFSLSIKEEPWSVNHSCDLPFI